jgi:hypothetical protein
MEATTEDVKATSSPMTIARAMRDAPKLGPLNPNEEANDEADAAGVSNETEALPTIKDRVTVSAYAARYRAIEGPLVRKNAGSFIELCLVIEEAKEKLEQNDFVFFCLSVGINPDPQSSAVRRMVRVGAKAPRFAHVMDRLPGEWTTIADLAALDDAKFALVVKDARFTPKMTKKVLNEILGNKPKTQSEANKKEEVSGETASKIPPYFIGYDTQGMLQEAVDKLHLEASTLGKQFNCPLMVGEAVEAALKKAA